MVQEINLALLEQLLRATPQGALQQKLLALREQAYVTEFVEPGLLMAYEHAKVDYANHSRRIGREAEGSGTTLH